MINGVADGLTLVVAVAAPGWSVGALIITTIVDDGTGMDVGVSAGAMVRRPSASEIESAPITSILTRSAEKMPVKKLRKDFIGLKSLIFRVNG